MTSFEARTAQAVALVRDARAIAAFTGAGISTESGLSDFRSPGGVWDRHRVVPYQEFIERREARVEYWTMKREFFTELRNARPNSAHAALAELEARGKLSCIITQNIDGLHQEAGNRTVIELHGTNREAVCLGCDRRWPIEDIHSRLETDGFDPACESCGGHIKPATISFGQAMPVEELARAFACAASCDLLLMIGSSLQVEPAASIPREAHRGGVRLIFINRTETPWDHLASLIFREDAGEILSRIVAGVSP